MSAINNDRVKKRIAMLIPDLHYGGVERVAGDLSKIFCENGYQVYFFLGTYESNKSFPYAGIIKKVDYGRGISVKKTFIQNLPVLAKKASYLKNLKRKYKIDIAISFHAYINLLNIMSRDKDRVLLTIHEVTSVNAAKLQFFFYSKFLFEKIYNKANKVICVSEYCKRDLCTQMGMKASSIQVINNMVDEKRLDIEIREDLQAESDNIIVSVGRLEMDKQQWHILHAFKIVLSQYADARLIIIGEGELKEYLCNISEKLGISENTVFTGYQKNVGKYLKNAKMLVMTSETEALPCAVAEALYVGVPIVASDCKGGIREMISEKEIQKKKTWQYVEGGILVPEQHGRSICGITEEERELADAMIELLSNKEQWNIVSENCHRISKKYRRDNIERQWVKLLNEMIP